MASIHPSLRNILDVPETAPPRPRPDLRPQNHGPTRLRRIPGPPPPKSWLSRSKHAVKQSHDAETRQQHQSITLPEAYLVDERSLQHQLLKYFAINWNERAEQDQEYLSEIPLRLRETLLSYIAIFRAGEAQLLNPLPLLFPLIRNEQTSEEQEEAQAVRRLDLGNALGRWLSLKGLRKALLSIERESKQILSVAASPSSIPFPTKGGFQTIPDSWEDESEQQVEHFLRTPPRNGAVPKPIHAPRFPGLLHLSLALDPTMHDTAAVSWSGVLSIAAHLRTLESLSLAYWPLPTYTPEAAATFATVTNHNISSGQRVVYGGTNMYSALENDWRESSGILKSLSRSLYCLKWLDLTGCTSWLPALVWEDASSSQPIDDELFITAGLSSPKEQSAVSIWNGYWRGISWVGLGVGWTPIGNPDDDAVLRLTAQFNALHQTAQRVAKQIRGKRQAGKGHGITLDLGEEPEKKLCRITPNLRNN